MGYQCCCPLWTWENCGSLKCYWAVNPSLTICLNEAWITDPVLADQITSNIPYNISNYTICITVKLAIGFSLCIAFRKNWAYVVEWFIGKLNEIVEQNFPKTSNSWEADTRQRFIQYSSLCLVLIIQQIKYYSDKTIDFIRIWTTQSKTSTAAPLTDTDKWE